MRACCLSVRLSICLVGCRGSQVAGCRPHARRTRCCGWLAGWRLAGGVGACVGGGWEAAVFNLTAGGWWRVGGMLRSIVGVAPAEEVVGSRVHTGEMLGPGLVGCSGPHKKKITFSFPPPPPPHARCFTRAVTLVRQCSASGKPRARDPAPSSRCAGPRTRLLPHRPLVEDRPRPERQAV
jgi:hypothetical protein